LLNGQLTLTAITAGIAIYYAFGAVHALSHGHGKTLG
jgi:ABC-type nickel/cobalt efflux system permease component RcnA